MNIFVAKMALTCSDDSSSIGQRDDRESELMSFDSRVLILERHVSPLSGSCVLRLGAVYCKSTCF